MFEVIVEIYKPSDVAPRNLLTVATATTEGDINELALIGEALYKSALDSYGWFSGTAADISYRKGDESRDLACRYQECLPREQGEQEPAFFASHNEIDRQWCIVVPPGSTVDSLHDQIRWALSTDKYTVFCEGEECQLEDVIASAK